jgi:hypothetical protein
MNEIDNPIYTRLTKKKHSLGCRKYIPNLGTFWLKIEQFWPFEETSIEAPKGASIKQFPVYKGRLYKTIPCL